MKWKQIKIHTTTQAVDLISDMLAGLGVCGIEIEDNVPISDEETKGMFIDILPDLPPDDGTAKVSFYLSADEETKEASFQSGDTVRSQDEPDMPFEELMEAVKNGLADISSYMDIGSGEIEISETADADWMNAYKEFFKPFVLGNVLIKPVWEEDVPHD
ncbi:MAG: 50S ribosomal protein L11 methyltransferase, partial [Oscillospiraceae bacterium]|nr:50S ribosomal protein L11 methyltransferase [Oscillospiraceae bacterium]